MPPWLEDFIGGWVGMQFGDSPREAQIRFVFEELLSPDSPNIVMQSYYDNLSVFATIAAGLFLFETVKRLLLMAHAPSSASDEARQLAFSALFLFGFVAGMPGFLASTQIAFNEMGKFFALTFIGSEDPEVFIDTISKLSNNGGLDFFLSIVQMAVLLVFSISLVLVPFCLYLSSFMLVIGVSMRWMGGFGESLFRMSLLIATYALIGNGVALTIAGIGAAFVRDMYKDNPMALALANTGIFVVAAIGTVIVLVMFKQRINATVQGAVSGLTKGTNAIRGGFHRNKDAGKRQVDEAVTTRKRRSQASDGNGSESGTSKLKTRTENSTDNTVATSSTSKVSGGSLQTRASRPSQPRRFTSTAARSSTRLTDTKTKPPTLSTIPKPTRAPAVPPPKPPSRNVQVIKAAAQVASATTPAGRAAVVARHALEAKRKSSGSSS